MKDNIDLTQSESKELISAIIYWHHKLNTIKDGTADRQLNSLKSLLNKLVPTWERGCNHAMAKIEYEVFLNFKPTTELMMVTENER